MKEFALTWKDGRRQLLRGNDIMDALGGANHSNLLKWEEVDVLAQRDMLLGALGAVINDTTHPEKWKDAVIDAIYKAKGLA